MITEHLRSTQEQAARDLLTGAVEGGTGSWAYVSDIVRDGEGDVARVLFHPNDDDADEFAYKCITYYMVVDAMQRIARPTVEEMLGFADRAQRLRKGLPVRIVIERTIALMLMGEAPDWDADTADAAVQVAMFGSIVYG